MLHQKSLRALFHAPLQLVNRKWGSVGGGGGGGGGIGWEEERRQIARQVRENSLLMRQIVQSRGILSIAFSFYILRLPESDKRAMFAFF